MSTLDALALSLPTDIAPATAAAVEALATATTRDEVRAIVADWRASHWDAWADSEAHARRDDAQVALLAGDHHLLEIDGSWRVDYLPAELHRAESAALARCPAGDVPAVYYRTRS